MAQITKYRAKRSHPETEPNGKTSAFRAASDRRNLKATPETALNATTGWVGDTHARTRHRTDHNQRRSPNIEREHAFR
jgi:hypothetical protein